MNLCRSYFDSFYDRVKPILFFLTKHDPQKAHEAFVTFSRLICFLKLERFLLDNKTNYQNKGFVISNAAGFNKNGTIPPSFLRFLGFDRIVVGTVTAESWKGNPRPHILRISESESLINWMGLPNIGKDGVRNELLKYKNNETPVTINIAPTPNKKDDDALRDLEATIDALKTFPFVDRFEINISCPNTEVERADYQKQLRKFISATQNKLNDYQRLYIKVSPDLSEDEVNETVSVIREMKVHGIVTTNTTTKHSYKRGGASGELLYKQSLGIQKLFYEKLKSSSIKIVACGGINSCARLKERIEYGADEIQIFTPLIFSGPRLLRELRSCY